MVIYGLVPKKNMGRMPRIDQAKENVKNKQNSSVNFLVRARMLIRSRRRRRRENAIYHFKHHDSIGDA